MFSKSCNPKNSTASSPILQARGQDAYLPRQEQYLSSHVNLPADFAVGLCDNWQTHPVNRPCIQVLFVGSGLCRRLPSHKHSHACTCLRLVVLPLGSTAPTVDFHHLVNAHAGQTKTWAFALQKPMDSLYFGIWFPSFASFTTSKQGIPSTSLGPQCCAMPSGMQSHTSP